MKKGLICFIMGMLLTMGVIGPINAQAIANTDTNVAFYKGPQSTADELNSKSDRKIPTGYVPYQEVNKQGKSNSITGWLGKSSVTGRLPQTDELTTKFLTVIGSMLLVIFTLAGLCYREANQGEAKL